MLSGDFFGSLPSPLDMAQVFQAKGKFHKDMLYPVTARSTHASAFSKAIVTGMNYEDMCYCMVFNQSGDYLAYLNVVKAMYDVQGVPFFKDNAMTRFKKNVMNSDSLFTILAEQHSIAEEYMGDNDRAEMSLLISIAANIEAVYLWSKDAGPDLKMVQSRMSDEKFMLEEYETRLKKMAGTDEENLLKKITGLKDLVKTGMTQGDVDQFMSAVLALRAEFLKN
jgi:hypothetical protein